MTPLTKPPTTSLIPDGIDFNVSGPTQQEPFTGPPIFISGCNRGGTTILTQLLTAHPEVQNVGRGQFSEGQYIWRRKWRDYSRHRWALPPWRWYLRRDKQSLTPATLSFFRQAFAEAMPAPGRMLEKTPANALRIPLIDALYPNSVLVHVIRDGRHTTASLIARRVSPLFAPHQWVQAHRIALEDLARLPADRVILVRYEELLAEPTQTLRHLCLRCQLRWDEAAADAVLGAAQRQLHAVEDRWAQLGPPIQSYCLRVIGELQRDLGYPVER